tara:strand:+ start:168 stop:482 length:315 start_codon:yes stop_codon:yes gene_type:complete
MSTNKGTDWMKLTQFAVFCISCVVGVMLWYFAQQNTFSDKINMTYVSKTELQLVTQRLEVLEDSIKNLKNDFNYRLQKMEDTNNQIISLVTDIRLTLASLPERN